ncbi:MAG: RNA-directed DNA polymerase, partial [Bacteroidetes bacterium]|nr:RNA-directed DNA polymerase [Bacteroidota bacterium]
QCSQNYQSACYILKLDIQGFFMHIDKTILFSHLQSFINDKYTESDMELLIELCRKVIFNDSTKNCIIKGKKSDWNSLPATKSLFHSPVNGGLPIGNLTSQIFANFYLDAFDHYIKHELQIRYYGRYVDDFVIMHNDKEYLKNLVPLINDFLQNTLSLSLHPRKIYLQSYEKGVQFLGAVIVPHRTYIASRTKGNFYKAIQYWNKIIIDNKPHKLNKEQEQKFLSCINSYLGIMKHYKTYKLRKIQKNIKDFFDKSLYIPNLVIIYSFKYYNHEKLY